MPRGRKTQPDYPGSLGSLLYDKRKAHGWPAKKVAAACSLSQTFIAAIERGARCPELDRVPDIALAYRLDVSLVCWTWIVQFAPRAAPYMVSPAYVDTMHHPTTTNADLLLFADEHAKAKAALEAAVAERQRQRWEGATQEQRALARERLGADPRQAILDSPAPAIEPLDHQVGPRGIMSDKAKQSTQNKGVK